MGLLLLMQQIVPTYERNGKMPSQEIRKIYNLKKINIYKCHDLI